jgi:hypothetical protein
MKVTNSRFSGRRRKSRRQFSPGQFDADYNNFFLSATFNDDDTAS